MKNNDENYAGRGIVALLGCIIMMVGIVILLSIPPEYPKTIPTIAGMVFSFGGLAVILMAAFGDSKKK